MAHSYSETITPHPLQFFPRKDDLCDREVAFTNEQHLEKRDFHECLVMSMHDMRTRRERQRVPADRKSETAMADSRAGRRHAHRRTASPDARAPAFLPPYSPDFNPTEGSQN